MIDLAKRSSELENQTWAFCIKLLTFSIPCSGVQENGGLKRRGRDQGRLPGGGGQSTFRGKVNSLHLSIPWKSSHLNAKAVSISGPTNTEVPALTVSDAGPEFRSQLVTYLLFTLDT